MRLEPQDNLFSNGGSDETRQEPPAESPTLAFLRRVLPDAPIYYGESFSTVTLAQQERRIRPKPLETKRFTSRAELAAWLTEQDAKELTTYVSMGGFVATADARRSEFVIHLGGLWSDVDCGPGKPYATQADAHIAVVAACEKLGLPLPINVSSGRGLHLHWPARKSISVADWEQLEALLRACFDYVCLKYDPELSSSPVCLMRAVGTHNRKDPAHPLPVEYYQPDVGERFAFDDLFKPLEAYAAQHGVKLENTCSSKSAGGPVPGDVPEGMRDLPRDEHADLGAKVAVFPDTPEARTWLIEAARHRIKRLANRSWRKQWFELLCACHSTHLSDARKLAIEICKLDTNPDHGWQPDPNTGEDPEFTRIWTGIEKNSLRRASLYTWRSLRFDEWKTGRHTPYNPPGIAILQTPPPPVEITDDELVAELKAATHAALIEWAARNLATFERIKPKLQAAGIDAAAVDEASAPAVETQSAPGGKFEKDARAVWFTASGKEGEDSSRQFVSSLIHVVAQTRDSNGDAWGRLLRWQDRDGADHEWALPMSELQGDGLAVRQKLADGGVEIAPSGRNRLALYLQSWKVSARARCVDKLGWHGRQFIMGNRVIGQPAGDESELTVFQSTQQLDLHYGQRGTVEEWKERIGAKARGNPLLMFTLCAAIAAPLYEWLNIDPPGIHIEGSTSTGKSTHGYAAQSFYGPRSGVRAWDTTKNGLEPLCAAHTDSVLVLDEISRADPTTVGQTAYMFASGIGKGRMSRDGGSRKLYRWRTVVISSGEESLESYMRKAGKGVNPGMLVRLMHLPADAGKNMGCFSTVPGDTKPSEFAKALEAATYEVFGAPGVAWLERVAAFDAAPDNLTAARAYVKAWAARVTPAGSSSAVERGVFSLAPLALAGEMATRAGLTGWEPGEPERNVAAMCRVWAHNFGIEPPENTQILRQAQRFFEAHGSSRFERLDDNGDLMSVGELDPRTPNRAGFAQKTADGALEFLVLPECFRFDLCGAFSPRTVRKVLLDAGWLKGDQTNRSTCRVRLPGLSQTRAYRFVKTALDEPDET